MAPRKTATKSATKAKAETKATKPETATSGVRRAQASKTKTITNPSASKAKLDAEVNEKKETDGGLAPAPNDPGGDARHTGEVNLDGGKLDFNRLADILADLDNAVPVLQGSNKTKIIEHFAMALADDKGFDHAAFMIRAT